MDLTVSTSLADTLAALRRAQAYGVPASAKPAQQATNLPAVTSAPAKAFETTGTKLVNDTREELADGGFRRTRTFEREDGRKFTRIEDFAFTEQGARRTVIQQNPSGNITRYEEVLDREGGGNFRRTQRFQDESGETAVQITGDYKVTDPFILTGGQSPASFDISSPFNSSRGTQLDLRA